MHITYTLVSVLYYKVAVAPYCYWHTYQQ